MKMEEFEKGVERGDIGPLYYIYGDEPYLIERGVNRLLARAVSPEFRDFNLNLFYGNECRGDEIVESAQTLPVFADRRVVLVRKSNGLSAAALEVLTEYVQDPAPGTCLIFQGEKADLRKKFFLEVKKNGALVECKRLYENQLGAFIREEAASYGKKVDGAAAELLVYLAGNNLQELASQLEKVATYVGPRGTITIDDVKDIVSDTRVDSVFELANAIGAKDLGKALRSLHTLVRDGEAPLMVLAMVTRHFRQLWRVRELLDRRVLAQEIGKAVGINPYFLKGIVDQARNYRVSEFKGIFERFYATDLAMKSGGGKPVNLMELLVMEICTKR